MGSGKCKFAMMYISKTKTKNKEVWHPLNT